ncbi:MAG: glycosyltransferase family 39 protein [Candidatus Euphemobacter frigidus]|nr:glycosyltransferase family 39 protein [Candidatus Euphemobacter frigidus]MDP8276133.1 glycosyltransferase family 39 protein [Candidatus Euphemobacter frigidus]
MKAGSWLLLITFILFLLVRIFVPSPYYFISLDEAKYLTLARSFPRHTLFNNQLYLVHPPLFPYLIRAFSLTLPDHIAGMTVSLVFAAITFAAMVKLFRLFEKDRYWIVIALFVLAISPLHIPTSRVVYKDSMFFGLFAVSLYLFIKGILRPSSRYLYGAGLAGAACCLTSDLALSLIPVFAVAYLVFRRPGVRLRAVLVSGLFMLIAYGGWLLVRIIVYKHNIFYPAGVDGTIEYVRSFTFRQLFTPRYFPATATMFNFSVDLSEFRINANVYPLAPLVNLPIFCSTVFYGFIAATALYSIIHGIKKRLIRDNAAFFFSLLLIIFTLPVVLHPEPRFLFPILLPMSFLFAHGVARAGAFFPHPNRALKVIARGLILVLAVATTIYLVHARHCIFSLEKEVEVSRTAQLLRDLPGDGVMAQVGYPPELVYLTGKRVLALPITPMVLNDFIRRYGIRYLLYGQRYLAPIATNNPSLIWCYHTIRHIRSNPKEYPLLRVIDEVYRSGAPPDRIFIHGVRQ